MNRGIIVALILVLILSVSVAASALIIEIRDDLAPEINPSDNLIGKDKAVEIALNKAGLSQADFVKAELDRENGAVIYEVEIRSGRHEYSADVRADDGRIVDWDVDFDD